MRLTVLPSPTRGFAARLGVTVLALALGTAALAPGEAQSPSASAPAVERAAAPGDDDVTAGSRYGWGGALWDYAWELGESLSSPAYRGTKLGGGTWLDRADGTGRAVKYGGGVELQSGPVGATGDRGSVSLALTGTPDKQGRWEVRERYRTYESGNKPYTFVAELVPESEATAKCPSTVITIASSVIGDSTVKIGATRKGKRWEGKLTGYKRAEKEGRLYGIEVTKKQITWFVNGKAVARLRDKKAIPTVPLTFRMRMAGTTSTDMRKTYVLIDWVRHWDLKRGTTAPKAQVITKAKGGC